MAVLRVVVPNPDPLLPPSVDTDQAPIEAVARGVSAQLAAASPDLQTTDIQVIVASGLGFVLVASQFVSLNGVTRGIVRVDAIPASGNPVIYRFFVR